MRFAIRRLIDKLSSMLRLFSFRIYILFFGFCISFIGGGISHASTGKTIINTITGSAITGSGKDNTKDINTEENTPLDTAKNKDEKNDQKIEEEDTKNNLNISFIELGKTIGAKTIKNLNTRYTKEYPNISDRKKALDVTRSILIMRRNKKSEENTLSETGKIIITAFLDNMIELLDKKIEELEK